MKQAHYEIYQDAAGEWRWRLVAANGRTVADSGEGYKSNWGVTQAVGRLHRIEVDAEMIYTVPS